MAMTKTLNAHLYVVSNETRVLFLLDEDSILRVQDYFAEPLSPTGMIRVEDGFVDEHIRAGTITKLRKQLERSAAGTCMPSPYISYTLWVASEEHWPKPDNTHMIIITL